MKELKYIVELKLFKNCTFCIISFLFFVKINAQDLHFSQFYNSPLTANPANTGFMPDADYRVGGTYRNQYKTIPVPYKTNTIFADVQIARNKFENGWFGVGAVLLNDEAGVGQLKSTKAYASLAYHQVLNNRNLISAGFQGGMVYKSVNPNKFTFDKQWNGKFFNIAAPNGENFTSTNINYFDLNAGINYAIFPTDESYMNFGVSVQHINSPKESFFTGYSDTTGKFKANLARRYTAFFNGSFQLSEQVIVNPQAYFTTMAKVVQANVGANIQYNLSGETGESQLTAGAYYRVKDAIIPMLGIKHKSITATFTYDATASKLTPYNSMQGGKEISVIYTGNYYNNDVPKSFRCPSIY
jgi:type IX secretion system PorP/SprF family membrane protein